MSKSKHDIVSELKVDNVLMVLTHMPVTLTLAMLGHALTAMEYCVR